VTCAAVGYPKTIRVDQGSEFTSRNLDPWAYANDVTVDFGRPGEPTHNAYIEAFNGRLRAECLNAHWLISLDDAVQKCQAWRRDYNEGRLTARSATNRRHRCYPRQWHMARYEVGTLDRPQLDGPGSGCSSKPAGL